MTNTRQLDADLLSAHEIELLLRSCSRKAPTGIRNRAILALAWRSGLRCAEVLALAPKDINLEDGTITIQRGKGGQRRVVGLDAGTAELIGRWLKVRQKHRIKGDTLFCTLKGGQIDSSYIRHLLKRLSDRAGIDKRAHLHGLRHRFAVDLIKDGADLLTVQRLLGHQSAATTSIYLSRIGASEAVEFARRREWAAI